MTTLPSHQYFQAPPAKEGRINFKLPLEDKQKFEEMCAKNGVTVSQVLRNFITEQIRTNGLQK